MSEDGLCVPRDRLREETITLHHAYAALIEDLAGADHSRQRADDCEDPVLGEVLLDQMRARMQRACMVLEWLRRNDAEFAEQLDEYLYRDGAIVEPAG